MTADGRGDGVSTNDKSPRKRRKQPIKFPAGCSYEAVTVERSKRVGKRKRAKMRSSEQVATHATDESRKIPCRRSRQEDNERSTKSVPESFPKLCSPSEFPTASESLPKTSRGKINFQVKQRSGRPSTDDTAVLKENATKFQRSFTCKTVRASTRAYASKAICAVTPPGVTAVDGAARNGRQRKQRRKSVKKNEGVKVDDKMRIKRRVKNLVNRIRLEQNLIDAYAGEGWKGSSREKIRPEKELQRADVQIVRCKLAIRESIRDLDNLGLEGSLEDSAFDEEGRIFHDEIFCAKCKSQETLKDNDIILCDGACDRGFHQECLEPPLATADIPPGDEGWLCPVCDSKVECLNYINGYLGTDFQVQDCWENFFAAAAAGAPSNTIGEDWPSEDSDDNDYDPETKVIQGRNKEEQGGHGRLGSGHVDLSSGSDSEPGGLWESDFSSEDDSQISVISGDELEDTAEGLHVQNTGNRRVLNRTRFDSNPEIFSATLAGGNDVPLSGKRQRKPVDYKKLHDEMFGKEVDNDLHSEDEEWGPGRRCRRGKFEILNLDNNTESKGLVVGKEQNCVRKLSLVRKRGNDANDSNLMERESFNEQQIDKGKSRRLPDSAVKVLRKEFESGTSFPTGTCKHILAQRLGISFQQVCSWFKNARHAAKHGVRENTPTDKLKGMDEGNAASNGSLRGRELGLYEMEFTNGLLVEKLDEVQLKLHYLKQTLEAIVAKSDAGSQTNLLGRVGDGELFETGIVMSHRNGKCILYVPVAEVIEKDVEKTSENYTCDTL